MVILFTYLVMYVVACRWCRPLFWCASFLAKRKRVWMLELWASIPYVQNSWVRLVQPYIIAILFNVTLICFLVVHVVSCRWCIGDQFSQFATFNNHKYNWTHSSLEFQHGHVYRTLEIQLIELHFHLTNIPLWVYIHCTIDPILDRTLISQKLKTTGTLILNLIA